MSIKLSLEGQSKVLLVSKSEFCCSLYLKSTIASLFALVKEVGQQNVHKFTKNPYETTG